MEFTTAYHSFTQSLDGTDSYVALRRDLDQLMAQDPDNAVTYYILRDLADSYVTLYADQAISPDFAHQAKTEMIRLMDIIKPALSVASTSVEQRYRAVNHLVVSYQSSKKRF